LEWEQDVDNEKCESSKDDEWRFYASSEGYGHIYFRHEVIFYTNRSSMDEAKAAIHEWRETHAVGHGPEELISAKRRGEQIIQEIKNDFNG